MNINSVKNKDGFTFAEMIVTVAILGTIISIGVPKFTEMIFESKIRKSETTIINIQQAYFTHYYNTTFIGRAEFPPSPQDSLMTIEWSNLPLLFNGRTVANLFRSGKIPLNPNRKPYIYHQLPAVPELGLTQGFKLRDPEYQLESTYRL